MTAATERRCAVPGCGRPYKRAGYCYAHYMRSWRYGSPTARPWTRQQFAGVVVGALAVFGFDALRCRWLCVCDCGRICWRTTSALNQTGPRSTCGDRAAHRRGESPGYTAAHDRVRRDRGPAKAHRCAKCGAPARHWSYDHSDPRQMFAAGAGWYSADPARYRPMCVSCHKRSDLARLGRAARPPPPARARPQRISQQRNAHPQTDTETPEMTNNINDRSTVLAHTCLLYTSPSPRD